MVCRRRIVAGLSGSVLNCWRKEKLQVNHIGFSLYSIYAVKRSEDGWVGELGIGIMYPLDTLFDLQVDEEYLTEMASYSKECE